MHKLIESVPEALLNSKVCQRLCGDAERNRDIKIHCA